MGVNPCSQFAIVTCSTTHTSVELGRPGTFYARLLYCMHFVLKSFWARPSQSLHVICRICRRLLASNSLKAGPSSPAHGRDGERAAAEEWMMRPNPYFQRALWQLRSEEQTNTPTLLTAHHGFRVKAADAHSSSHPPFASPSVCVLLTPPRVKRTHRTSALYDRRWAGERDRKRCPNLTLLLAESYKPLPNGWHPKTSQTLKIRKNNMLVGDSGCLRCISMQKGHVTPFCPL